MSFNIMYPGYRPFSFNEYLQAANEYKWRGLRLAILITILTTLIVSTFPSSHLATVSVKLSPINSLVTKIEGEPDNAEGHKKNTDNMYSELLLINIGKEVLAKLKTFELTNLNSELESVIAGNVLIERAKQKLRTFLPFMPQNDSKALSPKQIRILKNNYELEHIIQHLNVRYSSSKKEAYVDYVDQNATLAIIIAKLAADTYLPSIIKTNIQVFGNTLEQIETDVNPPLLIANTLEEGEAEYLISIINKLTSESIKSIQIRMNQLIKRRKDIVFIRNLVGKYGVNVTRLLEHKQVVEHPLIQPYKRSVEISEMKLSDLTFLPERNESQFAAAKGDLLSRKSILIDQLTVLAINIDNFLSETDGELKEIREQLKIGKHNKKDLIRLQKELNKISFSVSNLRFDQLQDTLNQITKNSTEKFDGGVTVIDNYTSKLLEPNKVLIVALSFFLSILIVGLLVMLLVRFKSMSKRRTPHIISEQSSSSIK